LEERVSFLFVFVCLKTTFKARHEVDAKDWIAALTAAAQGKKA
jgi:hypothetical protein